MDVLHETSVLKFNPDTLQALRKEYDLNEPSRMEDSINHLINWLKKQNHFMRKEYSKEYLERMIILCKGSVEKSKAKLDKICTFRTLIPEFFEDVDFNNRKLFMDIQCCVLPKLTEDHYRVFILKNQGSRFETGFLDLYKYLIRICEYVQAYDYCCGFVAIFDYTDANVVEILKSVNFIELRNIFTIVIEGYGMRLKSLYLVTASKAIDTFVGIIKQAVNPKVAQRVTTCKDMSAVSKIIPIENLPSDLGGKEKSVKELSDELKNVLSSKEFDDYFKKMKQACTDESCRSDAKFNNECMGMPGSFRKLTVD